HAHGFAWACLRYCAFPHDYRRSHAHAKPWAWHPNIRGKLSSAARLTLPDNVARHFFLTFPYVCARTITTSPTKTRDPLSRLQRLRGAAPAERHEACALAAGTTERHSLTNARSPQSKRRDGHEDGNRTSSPHVRVTAT